MRYPGTPLFFLPVVLAMTVGCSRSEALVPIMQASFEEQFEAACGPDQKCVAAVTAHADACFDPALARQAIGAKKPDKIRVNTTHIRKFQACIAGKSGVDHWATKDMADFILSQVE